MQLNQAEEFGIVISSYLLPLVAEIMGEHHFSLKVDMLALEKG